MRRREFLGALGGAAAAAVWPHSARAQQGLRAPRVGILIPGTAVSHANQIAELRRGFMERGYVEPRTLELIFRFTGSDFDRLASLAHELVDTKVDVIVTSTTPAIKAAMAATSTIPIVMGSTADAVASGLVLSLARPGGNVTGSTLLLPELAAKQLELIQEILPGLVRIGVLRGRGEGALAFEMIREAATMLNVEARFDEVASADKIAATIAAMSADQCQAVILVDGPTLNFNSGLVAKLMLEHRLPGISTLRLFTDAGSFVSYGPNVAAMWHRAAYFVDRILKGTPPGELPVEQPTKFDLVINLKTAKALGITPPPMLLGRADEVIE